MENGELLRHSSPFFFLPIGLGSTNDKVPQSRSGRKENLNTLGARRLCGSILLFLAQRLRQRGLSQDAIGFR